METTRINLNEEPKGKNETEKLNVNTDSMNYSEPTDTAANEMENQQDGLEKKNKGGFARTVAAGIGGAAVGSGVAMAANGHGGSTAEEQPAEEPAPATGKPAGKSQEKPSDEQPDEKKEDESSEDSKPTDDNKSTGEDAPEPDVPSPHIEEILEDPDDIDPEHTMNIEGTGTVEIDGTEYNAALMTDEDGNTYYLVDVDGEVGDPNATYDIIVDAETGMPVDYIAADLTVSDAQLMADNGIDYISPNQADSNNVAQAEMENDIYDPSLPADNPVYDADETGVFAEEPGFDPMADFDADPTIDIIDPLA